MLKAFVCLFYYECLLRLRYPQEWLYPLGFFFIVMILFPLAITPNPKILQQYAAGFIWIAALFASLLSINHVFHADLEDGHLEQSILSPVPFTLIVFAKLIAQWIMSALPLIVVVPFAALIFHLPFTAALCLMLGLLLGTSVFTLVGSLGAALTLGLKHHGVLLGLIMLPLVIPILIFGINIVYEAEQNLPVISGLLFLGGITVLAITLLPFAIATLLRFHTDD